MARNAIVVGGGIGGLTTAAALERTGWHVELFEQAPAFDPVGAGIGIAPNAVKALDYLRLGEAVCARGVRQTGLEIRLTSGRRIAHMRAEAIEHRFAGPFIALHRAELHRLLLDALDSVDLRTGHRATGIRTAGATATVTLDGPDGPVSRDADLVVAADGVHSRLRTALFPDYPGPTYAGYTVWRGIVATEAARRIGIEPILSETWGRGARFGVAAINDGHVYWFACENASEGATPAHSLEQLATRFDRWHPPIGQLLAATPPDTLLRHDVYYLKASLTSFVQGRVVLLGDAAHAVTPDIGQGACLSIEDAVTLAAAIDALGIDDGLHTYDQTRRPRTERLAQTSGKLGHLLQTANPMLAGLRDAVAAAAPSRLLLSFAGSAFAWTPPGIPPRPAMPDQGTTSR
jgi:2-polyprenyl-6-methoxyphenol hydroxylase-like FAD-dependent oxidoreductase